MASAIDKVTVGDLARAFSLALRRELSAHEIREVVSRNAAEEYPEVCHSHDFCDANMIMAGAFESVKGREVNLQSDADLELWNSGWELAMLSGFVVLGARVKFREGRCAENERDHISIVAEDNGDRIRIVPENSPMGVFAGSELVARDDVYVI